MASFGNEDMVERKYTSFFKDPLAIGLKKGSVTGVLFGISLCIMFVVFALIFHFGTIFLRDYGLSISSVFTAIYALMYGGITAANNYHFILDAVAGKVSAANIF
jgi:hypothetical protein